MDSKTGFEATLRQLEQTVEELEAGDLGLDAALARYERGVRLLAQGHGLLDAAERKVAVLTGVDAEGNAMTAPFDANDAGDEPAGRPDRPRRRADRLADPPGVPDDGIPS